MITESDQEVFVFSLKDAQKIQVQERLRDKIMVRLEEGWAFPVLSGPGESRNPESHPLVRPGTQALVE